MATDLKIKQVLFHYHYFFGQKIYQLAIQRNRLWSNRHSIKQYSVKQEFGEKVFCQSGSAKRVRSKGFYPLVILGNGIR